MKTIGMVGLVLLLVAAVACGRSSSSAASDMTRDASVAAAGAISLSDTGKVVRTDA